jgi:hypothetical protein
MVAQLGCEVDDLEATVRQLERRGVVFEERDSEGNMLGIGQPVR